MKNLLWRGSKYFRHLTTAKNTKGHGIHSPYLYRFTHNAIYEKHPFYVFPKIEDLRDNLYFDDRMVNIKEYGTGVDRQMMVREIAKTSLQGAKWGQLLFRIVNFTKALNVLELGTSLGVTTAYLASPRQDIKCVTIEGSEDIAKIAQESFDKLEIKNIDLKVGNIDDILQETLVEMGTLDVVYFDANHTYEATLNYFNQCLNYIHPNTVFIFDDIYWSKEMTQAWKKIRTHELVTSSINLYRVGILFFNKSFPKRTYKMKY